MKSHQVPLGEIADFINGMAFKPSDWQSEGRRIIRIQNLSDPTKPYNRTNKVVDPKYLVAPGTILVSWSATLDVFEWTEADTAVLNQHIFKVVPFKDKVHLPYLKIVLKSSIRSMMKHTHGSTMKHINRREFLETLVPLPPLPEQKRIAAILEKADAIRQKREKAIELTDSFLRSVFLEMFGDPSQNSMNWNQKALVDVAETRLGKMLDGKKQTGLNPRPYLRNTNVKWGYFDLSAIYQMDFDESDRQEFALREGDVMICEGGEVGRCAVWREEKQEMYFQKALHRVRPNIRYLLPEYLSYFMRVLAERGGLIEHTSSATIAHLTGIKLKQLPIMLPPLEIQERFVNLACKLQEADSRMSQSLQWNDRLIANLGKVLFSEKGIHTCLSSQGRRTRQEVHAL
jgi:type I restriction enzyme S subunit